MKELREYIIKEIAHLEIQMEQQPMSGFNLHRMSTRNALEKCLLFLDEIESRNTKNPGD